MCRDSRHLVPGRRCVIYSIGINTDMRFDEAAAAAAGLGCEQHMLDHTVSPDVVRRARLIAPGRVFFHKRGLGVRSDKLTVSLSAFMAEQKHEFVDVLKIDCEGCGERVGDGEREQPPGRHAAPVRLTSHSPTHLPIHTVCHVHTYLHCLHRSPPILQLWQNGRSSKRWPATTLTCSRA